MSTNPVFVGIDVAKASLEVAVHQPAARWAVEYTDAAVVTLGARLTALAPHPHRPGGHWGPGGSSGRDVGGR